jgi:hypothetical protein
VQPITGLPGVVVDANGNRTNTTTSTTTGTTTNPAPGGQRTTTTPSTNTTSTITTPTTTSEVPPFSPLTASQNPNTTDSAELQADLLKVTMEGVLKNSKFQARLDSLVIDPRTNELTVKYIIPPTTSAAEAKKGLLYTGFRLIWTAADQSKNCPKFTLRGYTTDANTSAPSLALVADITSQQAVSSRSANDYRTICNYLTRPWWRSDLAGVGL